MRQARERAGGTHLQKATLVQEGAHKADDICAHDEDVTHVAVHNGVQVALPIPHLLREQPRRLQLSAQACCDIAQRHMSRWRSRCLHAVLKQHVYVRSHHRSNLEYGIPSPYIQLHRHA